MKYKQNYTLIVIYFNLKKFRPDSCTILRNPPGPDLDLFKKPKTSPGCNDYIVSNIYLIYLKNPRWLQRLLCPSWGLPG